MDEIIRRIGEIGIIPVVRAATVEEATSAVEAVCAGGIPIVEITMTVPNAVSVIRSVAQQLGSTNCNNPSSPAQRPVGMKVNAKRAITSISVLLTTK